MLTDRQTDRLIEIKTVLKCVSIYVKHAYYVNKTIDKLAMFLHQFIVAFMIA